MAVNLTKGQKVDLTKGNSNLYRLLVGLGWDTNRYRSGSPFDLDASAFLLGADGRVTNDDDFVFYGHLKHSSGSVMHMGDNITGEGEGDDEQIKVNLSAIPANIQSIAFTVTIYEHDVRMQNFGQVSNSFIRIVDEISGAELVRYDLGEDFSTDTAIVVGELYRNGGYWRFNAIGKGFSGGLKALCINYGVNV